MLKRRGVVALVVAIAAAGCSGSDDDGPERASRTHESPTTSMVTGPLCDLLPSGDDPGAPETLAGETADVALQWIPVVTTFESAVRAAGLADDLRSDDGITILAPTDDAFAAAFDRQKLDDLLLSRHGELRALLQAHLIDGRLSLAALRDADSVTTLAGDKLIVAPAGAMARFDGRATTVCADYDVANARIHVVDKVLR